jgi:hypothetical protein
MERHGDRQGLFPMRAHRQASLFVAALALLAGCWAGEAKAQYGSVGTAAGYLPVGTTTIPASMLGVYGGVTIGSSYISTTAPTNGAIIQGSVGIGTTVPNARLDVNTGANNDLLIGNALNSAYNTISLSGSFAYTGLIGFTGGSSSDPTLYIDAAPSTGAINFRANGFVSRMYIGSSGNVGIGTTAPQSLLHVQAGEVQVGSSGASCASANAGAIRYSGGSLYYCDNASTWESIDSSGTSPTGDYYIATQTATATSGQGLFGGSSTLGGILTGYGSTADVTLQNRSGTAALKVLANSTNVYMPGNVGIGTTSPVQQLDVVGTAEVDSSSGSKSYRLRTTGGGLDFEGAGAGMYYSIWSGSAFTGAQYNYLMLANGSQSASAYGTWTFYTGNSVGGGSPILVVSNSGSGSVGIGTTSPQGALQINTATNSTKALQVLDSSAGTALAVDTTTDTVTTGAGGLKLTSGANSATLTTDAYARVVTSGNLNVGGTIIYGNGNGSYYTLGGYGHTINFNVPWNSNTGNQNGLSIAGASWGSPAFNNTTHNLLNIPGTLYGTSGYPMTLRGLYTALTDNGTMADNVIGVYSDVSLGTSSVANRYPGIFMGGNVGIGTTAPQSKLHVQAGEVQVGSSGASCASANAGAIRYSGGTLYYCDNSSTWESIDSSGTSPTGDYYIATQTATATSGQGLFGGSSTLGGILTGYGSTADVTLQNRSGTAALEILANSTNVYMPGNVGIGTTGPDALLSLGGSAAQVIDMVRNPTASTAGNGLTVQAGGAASGGTDLAGGTLNIASGIATGIGSSSINFQTATAQGSTNTTDNSPTTKMTILGNGYVGIGTTTPGYLLDVENTSTATSGSVNMEMHNVNVNPSGSTTGGMTGVWNQVSTSGSASMNPFAVDGSVAVVTNTNTNLVRDATGAIGMINNNSTGSIAWGFGLAGYINNSSGGTVSNALALVSQVTNAGTAPTAHGVDISMVNSAGGTITSDIGVYVSESNAGTVANYYGLYIDSYGGTAPTTNHYGVYVKDAGLNYFAGDVGIGVTSPAALLNLGGNISASSWTTTGIDLATNAATYTDTSTAAAGTVTTRAVNSLGLPTLASTNAITVTNGSNLYIAGGAVKGSNTTLTNSYGEYIAAGAVGSATNSYGLYVNAQTGATNNYGAVFATGNVGIGTTSPGYPLSVQSANTAYSSSVAINTPATNEQAVFLVQSNGTSKWQFGKNPDDSFFIYDSARSNNDFAIASNGNMSLMSGGGNVGIGTTAPSYALDVGSPSASTTQMRVYGAGSGPLAKISASSSTSYGAIFSVDSTASTGKDWWLFSSANSAGEGVGKLVFKDNTDGIEPLVLTSSGNVGIGTTAPQATLDVNGTSIIIEQSHTPADNATCTAGTMWWDTSYIYVCTASGTVKRAALSTF